MSFRPTHRVNAGYGIVAAGVRDFGLRLVDELRSIGWEIEAELGYPHLDPSTSKNKVPKP
jgi:hypothetical protein